jgi:hypothetical protein
LVHGDKGSDDVRRWLEALEEVLIVSQPLPHGEAFNVLKLHVSGRLGHSQRNDCSSTDAALDHHPNECLCTKEALLSVPH